jgi:PhzF family phenazine biosynthesis protein
VLQQITEEMRQFETIFVVTAGEEPATVPARIFTVEEELPFAGHPVLGAAAAIHERSADDVAHAEWSFLIQGRALKVVSERSGPYFTATMDQGEAELSAPLPPTMRYEAASALGLDAEDLAALPLQVVSTGLPYLIVPVASQALGRAHVATTDFEPWLDRFGAKFVYVLDPALREGRTWDNLGKVEDVATGSAAGPAAAYLFAHHAANSAEPLRLRQGRFCGRPSSITVTLAADRHLWVGGPVRPVASGVLDHIPEQVDRADGQ